MAETIGFIGLGNMGEPIAANLIEAGYRLKVYNRTASKATALVQKGAVQAKAPAEVAEPGGVVLTMLSDDHAVEEVSCAAGSFVGITGFMQRRDGRGIALRFALWPEVQGQGLAREAAGAALRFGHDRAGLSRIVAIARASNIASRTVLGGIGMVEAESFARRGEQMLLYESPRR